MSKTDKDISQIVYQLRGSGPVMFLESQMKGHPSSVRSFVAAEPAGWIKAWGNDIEIMQNGQVRRFQQNPWQALKEFRKPKEDWLFGYLGYDLKNQLENLQSRNKALYKAPDMCFIKPGLILEIDLQNRIKILRGSLPEKYRTIQTNGVSVRPKRKIDKDKYIHLVEMAKQDIHEGDYYEINLSHALEFEFEGEPYELYESMKRVGPVPFGSYLYLGDYDICCASPERFLAKKEDRVWSQPIKGTASRQVESEKALRKLRESEKERAENLMIVDLVRNDLSRIALKNTVQVSDLFEIQSFETVHQMVSTVECKVDKKEDSIEIIKACFPMGSMTGAPKISAMEAIEKYENYKRGIYSGAIGYIDPNGDFDFNVVIRTAIIQNNDLFYPVGGAITSDSNPNEEWEETLVKARAITNILQNSEGAE
ncbi:MAG: anthranilate synthase component I family protein [Gracilimonas sp.]|nr:anthranilate synthase component I family protein [Gracilimonas sp.]